VLLVSVAASPPGEVNLTSEHGRRDRDTATGRLLRAYHEQGDTRARDRLVQLYLPLVETFARRYERAGVEHDDLMQVGSVGLVNAIQRFDRRRGEEFAAFAVPTIVGEIKRHIRDRAPTVKLPRPLQEAGLRLPQARAELTARLGRTPSDAELATELDIEPDDLVHVESAGRVEALTDEEDGLRGDPENGAGELDVSEERVQLAGAFRALDAKEQAILYLRFVKDLTRKQAADELGMSEGQLSRRTQSALAKLRGELERGGSGQTGTAQALVKKAEADGPSRPPPQARAKPKEGQSGRLLLRMPQSLHAELAEAAEREEVSLNQFITNTLAAAVRWRREGGGEPVPRSPTPRWLSAAIVTNIVVVVVAGAVAVILLLVAWQHGW
jgi:RNA polymerase sigma-B factor